MFDLRRSPVARILIPFAIGALAGYELSFPGSMNVLAILCLAIWIMLFVLFQWSSGNGTLFNFAFVSLSFILYLAVGVGTGKVTRPLDPGLPLGENVIILGEVLEDPYPGKRSWVLNLRLHMLVSGDSAYGVRTNLKVYMGMTVDSVMPVSGETWRLNGELVPFKNSGNPGEPDFESIMHRKNYWYRFFVNSRVQFNKREEDPFAHRISASRIRKRVSENWSGDPQVISLLKAVCLGDRSGLTNNMRQSYSAAGGMHLLAVSGLHVGLIWWVLQHAFGWMVCLFRKELYRALTIIALLWFYAYITGFSSSVSRSVTMFSFFTVARMIDQRTHPVNSILVSAFILILINPGKILDVGFQLSYAAILGIVTIFPVLRGLLKVKNRILKWTWEATTVSFAAQLSTAPLVVYYFHQLPAYSLITNLFAIPVLCGLIAVFVISVPFIATGVLSGLFNETLVLLGSLLNGTMRFVASIPGAVIGELHLDQVRLLILLVIVILGMLIMSYRSTIPRYGMLFTLSLWLAWTSWTKYHRLQSAEIVVSHFSGGSLVTFREGYYVDHYQWLRDSTVASSMERFKTLMWDNRRYEVITHEVITHEICDTVCLHGYISGCQQIIPGVWIIGNDRIKGWVIAGPAGEQTLNLVTNQPGDFMLLTCEPQIRIALAFKGTTSCDLIVDGSNRNWFIRRMQHGKEPIHFTTYQGPYLKRW